ncbi:MAG: hypothetical protein M3Y22_01325 [Pseudomonadota bacterium]|nr:hypothetical protein [Pseudomonadota bacterium]
MEDLGAVAERLRRANARLVETDPVSQFRRHNGIRAEASQCRDLIKVRADRLGVHPAMLLHIVDEEARLRRQLTRRPSISQLIRALDMAADAAATNDTDAQAALSAAQSDAAAAGRHKSAATAAARALRGLS